jgi:hypothetical protein
MKPYAQLDLFGGPLVGLLRAFPDRFAMPVEFVPPNASTLVDRHLLAAFLRLFLSASSRTTTFPTHFAQLSFRVLLRTFFPT